MTGTGMARTVERVPLDLCVESPHQQRDDMGDIDALARNIEVNGQLTPIIVLEDGGRYQVVTGHRRIAALKSLGRGEADALVYSGWDDPEVARVLNAENACRKDFTTAERERGIQEMMTLGVGWEEAAASSGEDPERTRAYARGAKRASLSLKATGRQASFRRLEVVGEYDALEDGRAVEEALAASDDWEARVILRRAMNAQLAEERADKLEKSGAWTCLDKSELPEGAVSVPDGSCGHERLVALVRPLEWGDGVSVTWWCADPSHAAPQREMEAWERGAEEIEGQMDAGLAELSAHSAEWVRGLLGRGLDPSSTRRLVRSCTGMFKRQYQTWFDGAWADEMAALFPDTGNCGTTFSRLLIMVAFPVERAASSLRFGCCGYVYMTGFRIAKTLAQHRIGDVEDWGGLDYADGAREISELIGALCEAGYVLGEAEAALSDVLGELCDLADSVDDGDEIETVD